MPEPIEVVAGPEAAGQRTDRFLADAIGAWRDLSPGQVLARAATVGPFTAPFNVSGQPAASLPAGLSGAGHPIGVQIVGKPLADALVLSVCRVLEAMLERPALPLARLVVPPFC